MFSSLFGDNSKKKPVQRSAPKANINKSIQTIRSAQETLEKRGTHLEKQIAKLTQSARAKLKKKNKKGAMYDLKRKKMLEKELSGIENKKLTLETQTLALENAQMNESVFHAVKDGVKAIETVNRNVNIDKVEDLMDDMQEMQEDQEAINDALGQPVTDFDEDELLKELEDISDEEEEVVQLGNIPEDQDHLADLPDAPSKEISPTKQKEKKEDDELAELESILG
jgi:charged multivesicular body protein 4